MVEAGVDVTGDDVDAVVAFPIAWDVDVIAAFPLLWNGPVVVSTFAEVGDNIEVLPSNPVVADGKTAAPASPEIRDDAAIVTFVSGRRPAMKLSTLKGKGEADA